MCLFLFNGVSGLTMCPRIVKTFLAPRVLLTPMRTSCRISVAFPSSQVGVTHIYSICPSSLCYAGFSDPIYAEAYVKVHGFDILLGTLAHLA